MVMGTDRREETRMLKHSKHGFYLIGILLALVIMCILTLGYFERDQFGVSTYSSSMTAAGRAECLSNQKVFQVEIARWSVSHPNEPATIENLEKSIPPVRIPVCRDGGTWTIDGGGQVYCSVHNPEPTPAPTPTPRPAIDFLATPAAGGS